MDLAEILDLEQRALSSWPALETVIVGGWALRFTGGYTKRANSANALSPSGTFEAVLAEAERFYASRNVPPIFRLSPLAPKTCDAVLESRGYRHFDLSLVMVAPLGAGSATTDVQILEEPIPEWLAGFAEANAVGAEHRRIHEAIIRAVPRPAAFATLLHAGQPVAFGFGTRERGMIGLFDIVVMPAWRGKGHGKAIVEALLAWGRLQGAKQSWLQVRADNEVALRLYKSLGFVEAYCYHYRISPDPGPSMIASTKVRPRIILP